MGAVGRRTMWRCLANQSTQTCQSCSPSWSWCLGLPRSRAEWSTQSDPRLHSRSRTYCTARPLAQSEFHPSILLLLQTLEPLSIWMRSIGLCLEALSNRFGNRLDDNLYSCSRWEFVDQRRNRPPLNQQTCQIKRGRRGLPVAAPAQKIRPGPILVGIEMAKRLWSWQ